MTTRLVFAGETEPLKELEAIADELYAIGNTAVRKAEETDDEAAADTLQKMALTFNRLGKRVSDFKEKLDRMVIE
jgi:hypothetical protein